MGVFSKAEKKIDTVVGGVFARAFKGDVQILEITQRIARELDANTQVLTRDKRLVPNDFLVSLSKHDYAQIFPVSKTADVQIADDLRRYATEHGYVFNGPITLRYEERPDLHVGQFFVKSTTVAEVDSRDGPQSIKGAGLVLEVNGVRHPLRPGVVLVIGRGSQADLRINDPGISREHAEIQVTEDADGLRVRIVDLGSTNGVIVDGRKIAEADLTHGSHIDVGRTHMLVFSPTAPPAAAAVRA